MIRKIAEQPKWTMNDLSWVSIYDFWSSDSEAVDSRRATPFKSFWIAELVIDWCFSAWLAAFVNCSAVRDFSRSAVVSQIFCRARTFVFDELWLSLEMSNEDMTKAGCAWKRLAVSRSKMRNKCLDECCNIKETHFNSDNCLSPLLSSRCLPVS